MSNARNIWNYEKGKARRIAVRILTDQRPRGGWRVLLLPFFLIDAVRYRKTLRTTCKNLLYTRKMAFGAAQKIIKGDEDRALALGRIDMETRILLKQEKRGLYTEKIRKKQLREIEMLVDHYLRLLQAQAPSRQYSDLIRAAYRSKGKMLAFYGPFHKVEKEVVQAAVSSLRKGSKTERRRWLEKIMQYSDEAWREEIAQLFQA